MRKWDHVVLDFVVGMPKQEGFDTILTVVDKGTKMCHFLPCNESISAKEVAALFWRHVGNSMVSPALSFQIGIPGSLESFGRNSGVC